MGYSLMYFHTVHRFLYIDTVYIFCILLIDEILRFIQDGFSIPVLSSYSAAAVQSICHKCKGQLAHLFESLVVIIQTADNIGMSNTAVVGLITGN